jgi:flagellar assembly protein FliH
MAMEKFLFDTWFDTPPAAGHGDTEAVNDAASAPAAPTYSHKDLDAAREEGHAAGRRAGLEEAAGAAETLIAETLEAAAGRLEAIEAAIVGNRAQARTDAQAVAVAICRKIFPGLDRRDGVDEVATMVDSVLDCLMAEPRIVVRVNDQLHERFDDRLRGLVQRRGYEGRLVVTPDAALAPGDAHVEWSDGRAIRETGVLWGEIDAIARRHLGNQAVDGAGGGDREVNDADPQSRPVPPATERDDGEPGAPAP